MHTVSCAGSLVGVRACAPQLTTVPRIGRFSVWTAIALPCASVSVIAVARLRTTVARWRPFASRASSRPGRLPIAAATSRPSTTVAPTGERGGSGAPNGLMFVKKPPLTPASAFTRARAAETVSPPAPRSLPPGSASDSAAPARDGSIASTLTIHGPVVGAPASDVCRVPGL